MQFLVRCRMGKAKKWMPKDTWVVATATVVLAIVGIMTYIESRRPKLPLGSEITKKQIDETNIPERAGRIITPIERPGKPPDNTEYLMVREKYDPSGFMGDINDILVKRGDANDTFRYEPTGIGDHEWEWKYVHGVLNNKPAKFAGIMYLDPPNSWGTQYGGFDLRKVGSTIHWEARSLRDDVFVHFVIGGVMWIWDEKTKEKISPIYPDSMPRTSLGVRKLTREWQTFQFSLIGHPNEDFMRVVGGFAWVIDWDSNRVRLDEENKISEQPRVFEIEIRNIYYERK